MLDAQHLALGQVAVVQITATRRVGDATSEQERYYLLSAAHPPDRFNHLVRGHWGIENGLHWVLDVTCNKSQARNRKANCAENLAQFTNVHMR